ncbi:hypothetical protein BD289DRAFT_486756 [Coniella lustricola]|uniref:DUF5672 domain-containing protein n=1 Tax=Coniella lustricola TaxID=2025994 RepID=A0A2T2ZU20_9PEZI|nr:hypothetical protein BD289DRAFT_486756 [Coniella lustricola]
MLLRPSSTSTSTNKNVRAVCIAGLMLSSMAVVVWYLRDTLPAGYVRATLAATPGLPFADRPAAEDHQRQPFSPPGPQQQPPPQKEPQRPFLTSTINSTITPSHANADPNTTTNPLLARLPTTETTWHTRLRHELTADPATNLTAVPSPFDLLNRTRVALLMEDRPLPYLVPLLLHFMAVVPPEWSFRFLGSEDSVAMLARNPMIARYVAGHKLFLDLVPIHFEHGNGAEGKAYNGTGTSTSSSSSSSSSSSDAGSIADYDSVNHLLTRSWLYASYLWPAEWVFYFQDDSMICSGSQRTLNDFVDEDWSFLGVSAEGYEMPHALGGGFSLRKVPHLVRLLEMYPFEKWSAEGYHPSEDYYFSVALGRMSARESAGLSAEAGSGRRDGTEAAGEEEQEKEEEADSLGNSTSRAVRKRWSKRGGGWAKQPNGYQAIRFGAVVEFPSDPDEMPLGFHPFATNGMFRGAEADEMLKRAHAYCPELAIVTVGRWECQCRPNLMIPGEVSA